MFGLIVYWILANATPSAWALEQIIHPFQSVRTSGMGGVQLTTGFYEQNLLGGNPARHSSNKIWKFYLLDASVETNTNMIRLAQSLKGGLSGGESALIGKIAKTAGQNNHGRAQFNTFHVYLPNVGGGKMSYALGLVSASAQADASLRRNFQIDPTVIVDAGPSIGVSRKFLADESLLIGANIYGRYRLSMASGISLTNIIQGASLNPLKNGGEGGQVDFDLGETYRLPWSWKSWQLMTGASLNNVMGGDFPMATKPMKLANSAMPQKRRFGFGVSAQRDSLWKFDKTMLAIEAYDIGNNSYGSTFRLIHMGGEIAYGVLRLRGGLNQGYWAAGLGLDLKALLLDFATYGEEMSYNIGTYEDRRYALRLSIQI